MRKVFNFNAGPAMLPEEVLLEAQKEMLDWHGTGMSIMELGHRGSEFGEVARQAEADLRELMSIPDNYHTLFLTGGATGQFAMVPINLMGLNAKADYIDTGIWSKKAIAEAAKFGKVNVAAKIENKDGLIHVPEQAAWTLDPKASYVHYTPNETVEGIEFNWIPETGDVPLVADMSSMILSRPIDVTKYGVIYAGAQKNLGQAGVTLVIVRDDLVKEPPPRTPTLYSYETHVKNHSFYNTPPTYSWYVTGLMLSWLKRQGGVDAVYKSNLRKAKKVYDFITKHKDFYVCNIHPDNRSIMNIVFNLPSDALTDKFNKEATAAGFTNLKGHRIVGGIRISSYNSMPETAIDKLLEFMDDFAK